MYDPIPSRETGQHGEENEASPIIRRVASADSVRSTGSVGSSLGTSDTRNVRINVVQDGVSQRLSRTQVAADGTARGNYPLVVLQTAMQLPPALVTLVMVPFTWTTESCDQPLAFWAFCYAFTLLAALAISWVIYFEPTEEVAEMSSRRRLAERLRKPVENFALIWLIMGQVWLQSAGECSDSAPALVTLCFWLVVIGYCYFLLPCIIIVLMLPFLCFCLPCVIRLLSRYVAQNPMGANKGAAQDAIDALPLKKYHEGLFQGETDPQCVICISSYEADQEVRFLPCDARHHFHASCVDDWLKVNASCPICRGRIDGTDEENASEVTHTDIETGSGHTSDLDDADREARRPLASA